MELIEDFAGSDVCDGDAHQDRDTRAVDEVARPRLAHKLELLAAAFDHESTEMPHGVCIRRRSQHKTNQSSKTKDYAHLSLLFAERRRESCVTTVSNGQSASQRYFCPGLPPEQPSDDGA